ncbi:hypothetical protein GQ43DRAFT_376511 [Delitschia confertaspora ATCC 74209]|uniref:Transmembrane protein n=1 Tax=Delitschia confertaspora ATCC 74209 TaxID=1513339 RepID=A0A9P4JH58_9PLEO|nr:hypothetical protein GQ43DRAFT_376511 [Delitschia confertaspora ATCC 74209]
MRNKNCHNPNETEIKNLLDKDGSGKGSWSAWKIRPFHLSLPLSLFNIHNRNVRFTGIPRFRFFVVAFFTSFTCFFFSRTMIFNDG